jgi:hypothetical protein
MVRIYPSNRWTRGGGTTASRNSLLAGLIHGGVTPSVIWSTWARIKTATARITAEIVDGELSWWPDLFQSTVPWRIPFSAPDSQDLGQILSWFYVVTWSTLFSKVVALESSYNIVIVILSKFLLDHAWTHVQSHCSCTVSLKFRL